MFRLRKGNNMEVLGHRLNHSVESSDHTTDIVPLSERRSPLTMGLLWITMVTGFPTVFVGFDAFKAGHTLPQLIQGVLLGCFILLLYGIPAAYMGSKSGQTYGLLSRVLFGSWGSRLVSANLVIVNMGWYGLTATFLAEGLKGLYPIDIPTVWLAAALTFPMAINNFFGFSGIANFAKYIAAPLLILWVGFTFCKATGSCPTTVLTQVSHTPLPQALTMVTALVVGYGVWGNEPDFWRYGKPRVILSAIPLIVSLAIGQFIFPITGWMMAYLSGITDVAGATNLMNQYAFGGIKIIAATVLVVTYFAVQDSGLYGAINGLENIKSMPRKWVVSALAIVGSFTAILLAGNTHAFELVAVSSSIISPSATVIVMVEYFWLSKKSKLDFSIVHSFINLPSVRWTAIIALFSGYTVGFATSGLIPGLEKWHMGTAALQAWITALVVYTVIRYIELQRQAARISRLENLLPAQTGASPKL